MVKSLKVDVPVLAVTFPVTSPEIFPEKLVVADIVVPTIVLATAAPIVVLSIAPLPISTQVMWQYRQLLC